MLNPNFRQEAEFFSIKIVKIWQDLDRYMEKADFFKG